MPDIRVTPDAAREIQSRVARSSLPNTVVAIFRRGKDAEVKRGPNGEVIWDVAQPRHFWGCEVTALPDLDGWPVFEVDGIRFSFPVFELGGIARVEVQLIDGELNAHVLDA
jgi:hypothetical protein